jgi:hypothetical protein
LREVMVENEVAAAKRVVVGAVRRAIGLTARAQRADR